MKSKTNALLPHWLAVGFMLLSLLTFLIICHRFGHELKEQLPEERRMFLRSIFYVIAIILFPITNLIRHIQLRLNQTMPGNKPAKSRYLLTIIVSMVLVESVGILGFVLFILGDDFNTLYIFLGLSTLGLYLYRPKQEEYDLIVEALTENEQE